MPRKTKSIWFDGSDMGNEIEKILEDIVIDSNDIASLQKLGVFGKSQKKTKKKKTKKKKTKKKKTKKKKFKIVVKKPSVSELSDSESDSESDFDPEEMTVYDEISLMPMREIAFDIECYKNRITELENENKKLKLENDKLKDELEDDKIIDIDDLEKQFGKLTYNPETRDWTDGDGFVRLMETET